MELYKKEYSNKVDGVTIPLDQNFANALLDVKKNNDYNKSISEVLIQNNSFLDLLYNSAKDGVDSVNFDFTIWLSENDYTVQQTENQKRSLSEYVTSKLKEKLGLTVEYSIDDDKDSTGHIIFNIMFKHRLMESQGKVVKIKVGSVIAYADGLEVVKTIGFNYSKTKTVYYESGKYGTLNNHDGSIIAIDGICVEEIESIEV